MNMLARKITRSKWARKAYVVGEAIRADAITQCLKTTDDALSLWRCSGDERDVDNVFLALALGPMNERFETMDVVVFSEGELADAEIVSQPNDGDTAVQDLKARHLNAVQLDLEKLGRIAKTINSRIRDCEVIRRTTRQIESLVRDADAIGRVRRDELHEKLRLKLESDGADS
ncbi:MAG: hypothetical protein IH989_01165 [Planctomycetes bacterium]|nr:hypothetical protein [Planctomycetota bacterium]